MSSQPTAAQSPNHVITAALDALPEGVLLLGDDGRVLYANRLAEALIGRPSVVGECAWDGQAPTADSIRERLMRLQTEGGSATFEDHGFRDGQWLLYNAHATPQGVLLMVRPVDRPQPHGVNPIDSLPSFWHLFEHLPEGVCVVTAADRRCIGVNAAMARLLGMARREDLICPIDEWPRDHAITDVDGDPLPFEHWPVSRALAGDTISNEMMRIYRPALDDWITCSIAAAAVYDEHGQVAMAIITVRDVTEREETRAELQKAVDSLRKSERRFSAFMNHSPLLAWMADGDGRLTYFNDNFARNFRLDPQRDVGRHAREILPPDQADFCIRTSAEALQTNARLERILTSPRADGTVGSFLCVKFVVEDRDRRVAAGIAIDITERARIEEELRLKEQRLRALVEATTDGVWEYNLVTNAVTWSDRLYDLMRIDRSTPIKADVAANRVHPDDVERHNRALTEHIAHNKPYHIEMQVHRGDGTWATVISRGTAVRDDNGKAVFMLGAMQDVTEQRRVEQEVREARDAAQAANRAKDHFLAVLSHELRTPLTPVLLFSSSLERNTSLPDDVREDLSLIRQQVQLEARLIDDLLDLTRIQQGKMLLTLEPMSLNELLQRVAELAAPDAEANGLTLEVDLKASPDLVHGDSVRLHQLFSNVLANAVKFTPARGRIDLRSWTDVNQIVVEVSDTGIGIAPNVMPRVFNAFEQAEQSITRQYGGLGLGLTIGRAITEMHGGEIAASSPGPGGGTTIRITLPLLSEPVEVKEEPAVPAQRRRVLIVEDHEATREAMYRLLQYMGFDVLTADSVRTALRITSEHDYDALVCDIGLPDGLGTDLLKQLRDIRDFRAIALSGYGTDEDIRRSLDAGFEAHLIKPIDFSKLEATMKRLLEDSPAA